MYIQKNWIPHPNSHSTGDLRFFSKKTQTTEALDVGRSDTEEGKCDVIGKNREPSGHHHVEDWDAFLHPTLEHSASRPSMNEQQQKQQQIKHIKYRRRPQRNYDQ